MNLRFKFHALLATLVCALNPGARRLPNDYAAGTHEGNVTLYADGALTKGILVKFGSDATHVTTCGASDTPIGVLMGDADAAEDAVPVRLFGTGQGTEVVIASASITAGALVVPAADGKVRTLPVSSGNYWIVGMAFRGASGDADTLEIVPYPPTLRVV